MNRRLPIFLIAIAVVAPACIRSGVDHAVIQIEATDHRFEVSGSAPVRSGRTTIQLRNEGSEEHQAALARVNDDAKPKDVVRAAQDGDFETLLGSVTWNGGPSTIAPKREQVVEHMLEGGTYLLLCLVASPDGAPHVTKGMVTTIEVEQREAAGPKVRAASTIDLDDFSIGLPKAFAGKGTVAVANKGRRVHEMAILSVARGRTLDDVLATLDGPPKDRAFSVAGGIGPMAPDITGWIQLELPPGQYVAVCVVPEGKRSHHELGMVAEFTVR